MNTLFRTPDNALFETLDAARAHVGANAAVTVLAWCSDCIGWVPDGPRCTICGAPPYDEDGYVGFRGGMGRAWWASHQAERRALAAWNAGEPIRASKSEQQP